VVDFDNPEMKLFPGMTAYVTIPVAQASDVVKVPNGALRFTPDLTAQQLSDAYQKAGIAGGTGRGKKGGQGTQQQSAAQATTAVVWKLNADKSLEPVQIKLGITDHTTTEVAQVLKGSLNPQDQVITGAAGPSKSASTTAAPGMGATRGAGGGGRVGR
jgi:HlyD family secretion protein